MAADLDSRFEFSERSSKRWNFMINLVMSTTSLKMWKLLICPPLSSWEECAWKSKGSLRTYVIQNTYREPGYTYLHARLGKSLACNPILSSDRALLSRNLKLLDPEAHTYLGFTCMSDIQVKETVRGAIGFVAAGLWGPRVDEALASQMSSSCQRQGVKHNENEKEIKNYAPHGPEGQWSTERLRAVQCRPPILNPPNLELGNLEQGKYEEEEKRRGKLSTIQLNIYSVVVAWGTNFFQKRSKASIVMCARATT